MPDMNAAASAARYEEVRLKALQETPDSPEALATIPSLSLGDLPKESLRIPREEGSLGPATLLFHDLPTSSILYLDLAFPLDGLREELLPYVGLLGRALLETGGREIPTMTGELVRMLVDGLANKQGTP